MRGVVWAAVVGVWVLAACGTVDGDTGLRREVGGSGPGGAGAGGASQSTGGVSPGGAWGSGGWLGPGGTTTVVDGAPSPPCRQETPPCSSWVDGGCVPYDWAAAVTRYPLCGISDTRLEVCDPYYEQVTPTLEGNVILYFDRSGHILGMSAPTGTGGIECISYDPRFTAIPSTPTCAVMTAECIADAGAG